LRRFSQSTPRQTSNGAPSSIPISQPPSISAAPHGPTSSVKKSGVVVNISSEASRDPFAGFAAYGAAKAGLNLFGRSAAREGHPFNITVHTLAPSAVETAMFRQIATPEQYPADKTLTPADVARVILQCVRGDLRHTSGEVIYLHRTV